MASGKMFASLIQYASQDYFEAHPVMYLTVDGQAYRLELFAGYTTTADSTAYTLSFGSKHEFAQWLREVSSKSDFTTNMSLTTEDHIVTLSTCAYSFQDARYVVHGRLVAL
jgi:sortase B